MPHINHNPIDDIYAYTHAPAIKVCDKCSVLLDEVGPSHWANELTKNTATLYCSSESCGFLCPDCKTRIHSEKLPGSGKNLGETSGHRTFKFVTQAATLKTMECGTLIDATRACAAWVGKLKQKKQEILELGSQLAALSQEVESSMKFRSGVPLPYTAACPQPPHALNPPSPPTFTSTYPSHPPSPPHTLHLEPLHIYFTLG